MSLTISDTQTFKMKNFVTTLFCFSLGIVLLEGRQKAGTIQDIWEKILIIIWRLWWQHHKRGQSRRLASSRALDHSGVLWGCQCWRTAGHGGGWVDLCWAAGAWCLQEQNAGTLEHLCSEEPLSGAGYSRHQSCQVSYKFYACWDNMHFQTESQWLTGTGMLWLENPFQTTSLSEILKPWVAAWVRNRQPYSRTTNPGIQ